MMQWQEDVLIYEIESLKKELASARIHRSFSDLVEYKVVSIHGVGGVRMTCARRECTWEIKWDAHVAPPRLLDLTLQADIHTRRNHP